MQFLMDSCQSPASHVSNDFAGGERFEDGAQHQRKGVERRKTRKTETSASNGKSAKRRWKQLFLVVVAQFV